MMFWNLFIFVCCESFKVKVKTCSFIKKKLPNFKKVMRRDKKFHQLYFKAWKAKICSKRWTNLCFANSTTNPFRIFIIQLLMSLKFFFRRLIWIMHKLTKVQTKVQTGATVLKNKYWLSSQIFSKINRIPHLF